MMCEYTKEVTRLLLAFVFLHCVSITDGTNCDNSIPSISVCKSSSQQGRSVHLTGVLDNDDGIGCGCALQLIIDGSGQGTISIANITSAPSNCDFNIDSTYKTNVKRIFSCGNYEQNVQYELIEGEEVLLKLQKGTSNIGAIFCLEITSTQGSLVNIECSKTPTATVPTTGTITDNTGKSNIKSSTPNNNFSQTPTATVPTTGTNTDNTGKSNIKSSTPNNNFSQTSPSSEDETGFIVGIILAVIILITLMSLVVCVLYRKKKRVKNVVVPGDVKQIKH